MMNGTPLPNKRLVIIETEEQLTARITELFKKCDIDNSGKLRGAERMGLVKELQAELDLAKNPWAAQTNLRVEGDTDKDMLISEAELIEWVLTKKREFEDIVVAEEPSKEPVEEPAEAAEAAEKPVEEPAEKPA